ncbi:MAG: glycosyltransferase [Anaerolineae bacterium]|jgi:sugar transferase (PEP-CTERM/EpsH1 system associated)
MKILFLTPQLPYPPYQGTALRNWGLISGLARTHAVSLLSFAAPGQDPQPEPPLAAVCESIETVPQPSRSLPQRLRDLVLSGQPDMALRLESPVFRERLADWLARGRFDVVHVEGIELAPYLDVLEAARPRPLILFDDHNCEYLLQKRAFLTDLRRPLRWHGAAYSFFQWQRLRRFEAQVCRRSDRVVAVSEADAAALRALVPGVEPLVVPNGIDVTVYTPDRTPAPTMGAAALVFTGKMDFRPNVDAMLWFARHVLPLVRQEVPEAHLWVVGQRPHRRLEPLREHPAVTLTGWVKAVQPYIAGATVYVAPLRMGGGTRLKLLEAMALQRAVVATNLGAEGFPVTSGRELILADAPEAFAAAVVNLVQDPDRRAELGRSARRFVCQGYDWRVLIPRLESCYR